MGRQMNLTRTEIYVHYLIVLYPGMNQMMTVFRQRNEEDHANKRQTQWP